MKAVWTHLRRYVTGLVLVAMASFVLHGGALAGRGAIIRATRELKRMPATRKRPTSRTRTAPAALSSKRPKVAPLRPTMGPMAPIAPIAAAYAGLPCPPPPLALPQSWLLTPFP